MALFKNLPIRLKLFFPYSLVFLVSFTLGFGLVFFEIRKNMEARIMAELKGTNRMISTLVATIAQVSVKNHLRTIAGRNHGVADRLYQEVEAGIKSLEAAQEEASHIMMAQRVGKTGDVYCLDSRGMNVFHSDPKVRGRDFSQERFSSPLVVRRQIKKKNGYLEYKWKGPDEAVARPRAMYMRYFEPWDWIICVGSFRDEFISLVGVEDIKDRIMTLKVGHTGYSFILDTRGNALIHPRWTGNVLGFRDADGRYIVQDILRRRNGSLTYRMPGESSAAHRDRRIVFQYIPSLDWIVASGSYTRDVFAFLHELQSVFIIALSLSLGVTFLVTLLISSTITRPLTELISRFRKGAQGEWEVRMEENRRDELGELSAGFNLFMDQLIAGRKKLTDEIGVRREAETRLRLFEKVFEHANDGIFITDADGAIENINQAFTEITGYGEDHALGATPRILKSDHHPPEFYREMWEQLLENGEWSGEIWNRRRSGEPFPELLSVSAIRDANGKVLNYVAVFRDISDLKAKEAQIKHMAFHDPLTDLPNRALFRDRLRKAIGAAQRDQDQIFIVFIDLDDFKQINDTLGHAAGDQLLKEMAGRLIRSTGGGDTVGRLGGDEFIIMIPHIHGGEDVQRITHRIRQVFTLPFDLGEKQLKVTGSVGIAVYPEDGQDEDLLIRNADVAMYRSKQAGKNTCHVFDPKMGEEPDDS